MRKKIVRSLLVIGFLVGITLQQATFTLPLLACDSVAACDAELAQLAEDISETETKLAEQKSKEDDLRNQIATLNKQIKMTETQITTLEETINLLAVQVSQLEADIARQEETLLQRLTVQQKQNNSNTFLSLMLTSHSLADLMNRWTALETLNNKDNEIIDNLTVTKAQLNDTKLEQEAKSLALTETKQQLQAVKATNEDLYAQVRVLLEQYEAELQTMAATEADIAEQRDILNQPPPPAPTGGGGGDTSLPVSGDWYLPVGSVGTITTYFHERYEYSTSPHDGVDIAAATGTPIYSIASGYVLAAGWYGANSFGNLIAIGHIINGQSYVSMYGHLSAINVSKGDYVAGGARIGAMGNTGYSFGSHLHLELAPRDYFTTDKSTRQNTNVDPLNYLAWRGVWSAW